MNRTPQKLYQMPTFCPSKKPNKYWWIYLGLQYPALTIYSMPDFVAPGMWTNLYAFNHLFMSLFCLSFSFTCIHFVALPSPSLFLCWHLAVLGYSPVLHPIFTGYTVALKKKVPIFIDWNGTECECVCAVSCGHCTFFACFVSLKIQARERIITCSFRLTEPNSNGTERTGTLQRNGMAVRFFWGLLYTLYLCTFGWMVFLSHRVKGRRVHYMPHSITQR